MEKKNNNNNLKYSFLINNDFILVNILKYFDIKELYSISHTNKTFNNIINSLTLPINFYNNLIISSSNLIPISVQNKILKKIENYKINSLNIILNEDENFSLKLLQNLNNLQKLSIPLSILYENIFNNYQNLSELIIKNMYFNEGKMDKNIILVKNLLNLKHLKKLKLNNVKYITGEFLNYLKCNLEYLDLKESMEFKLQDIRAYLIKDSNYLQTLKIDGEYTEPSAILNILPHLIKLTTLTITYCENFPDEVINLLSVLFGQFKKLTLRKLRNISSYAFENFFKNPSVNLIKLDLYDAQHLNNYSIKNLYKNYNLEYLDLSWSDNIKNENIIKIFINCRKLKKIFLQGCKCLDDQIFEDSLLQKDYKIKKCLGKFLYKIDLTKCDLISDKIIKEVNEEYKNICILNYYGKDLRYDDFYYN